MNGMGMRLIVAPKKALTLKGTEVQMLFVLQII